MSVVSEGSQEQPRKPRPGAKLKHVSTAASVATSMPTTRLKQKCRERPCSVPHAPARLVATAKPVKDAHTQRRLRWQRPKRGCRPASLHIRRRLQHRGEKRLVHLNAFRQGGRRERSQQPMPIRRRQHVKRLVAHERVDKGGLPCICGHERQCLPQYHIDRRLLEGQTCGANSSRRIGSIVNGR